MYSTFLFLIPIGRWDTALTCKIAPRDKQEAHWQHRSPEKTVQINKHIIIIMLIKRRKNPLLTLWELNCSSFEQTWILISQEGIMPSLVEICPVVLEKKIFKSCQFIFNYFPIISPLEGRGPSFEQIWIPFTQGHFVPNLVKIGPVVLEKKMKMWKINRRTDRRRTTCVQLSWAKS